MAETSHGFNINTPPPPHAPEKPKPSFQFETLRGAKPLPERPTQASDEGRYALLPLTPEKITQTPEKAQPIDAEAYDPKAHFKRLHDFSETIKRGPVLDEYLTQLSPTELTNLRRILPLQSNHPTEGDFASVVIARIGELTNQRSLPEQLTNEPFDPGAQQQIRKSFQQFTQRFYTDVVDADYSPEALLQISGTPTRQEVLEREKALYKARLEMRYRPQNITFTESLIQRAGSILRKRIEEQERIQQQPPAEKVAEYSYPLDLQKEIAFAQLIDVLKTESQKEQGIQHVVMDLFNTALQHEGREPLTESDLQSLYFIHATSESASQIAGREIARPILLFTNLSEYQRFAIKLFGESQAASRGMTLPAELFGDSLLGKTGLIVSTNSMEYVSHEIRHTIDTNRDQRIGYDRILEELFAYYDETIVRADLQGFHHLANPLDGPWNQLGSTIAAQIYYDEYSRHTNQPVTYEQYKYLCMQAVRAIRKLKGLHGDLQTQRNIAQSGTLQDLFSLAEVEFPEIS